MAITQNMTFLFSITFDPLPQALRKKTALSAATLVVELRNTILLILKKKKTPTYSVDAGKLLPAL